MTRVKILFLLPLVAFVGAQLRPTPNRPLRPQVQVLEISSTTTEAPVRTTQKEITAPSTQAPFQVAFSSSTQRSGYLRSLFARPRPGDSVILPTESSEPSTFAPMITKPAKSFISTQAPTFVSSPTVQLPTTFFPSQPPANTEVNVQTTEANLLITESLTGDFISDKKDIDDKQMATTAKNISTGSTRLPFQESTEIPSSPSSITEEEPIFVSKFPLEPTRTSAKPIRTTTLEPKFLVTQNEQEPTFTLSNENVQNLRPTMRPSPQTMKPFVELSTTAKSIETTTIEQILPEVKTEDPTFNILGENTKNFRPTIRPKPQTMKPFVESSTAAKPIETTTLEQILPEVKTEDPTFTILNENTQNLRPTIRPRPQTMKPFVESSTAAKPIETTTLEQILPEVKTEDPTFTILDENTQNLRPTIRPRPQTIKPFVESSTAAKPIETTTLEQILPEVKTEDPTFTILDENTQNLRPTIRPRPQTMKPFVESSTAAKPVETTTLEQILPEVKTEDPTFTILDENTQNLKPTIRPRPQTMKPFVESSTAAKPIETTTLEQILPEVKTEDPTFTILDENTQNLRPTIRPRPQTMKPFVESSTAAKPIETTTLEQILPEVKTEDPTLTILDENTQNLRPTIRPRPQTIKPFVESSTTAKPIETTTLEQILPEVKTEDPTFTILDKSINNLRPTMRPQTVKPFVEPATTIMPIETTTLQQKLLEVEKEDSFTDPAENIENPRLTLRPRPQTMKPFVKPNTTAKPIETTTLESKRPISFDEENVFITTFRPLTRPTPTTIPTQTTTTTRIPRPRPIPPPDSSTRPPKTTFTPAPTIPIKTEGCASGVNAYFPVSNECDTYIECKKNVATKYSCPDGLHFNRNAVYPNFPCSYPSEVTCDDRAITQPAQPNAECPRQYGFFSRPDGICDSYIMCQGGKAQIMKCPPGLAFNPDKSSCDWPANVPSCNLNVFKGFSCPTPPLDENGKPSDLIYKFRYGNSCHEYVACQHKHPRLLRCDAGLSFDESSETCIDSDLVPNCSNAL